MLQGALPHRAGADLKAMCSCTRAAAWIKRVLTTKIRQRSLQPREQLRALTPMASGNKRKYLFWSVRQTRS